MTDKPDKEVLKLYCSLFTTKEILDRGIDNIEADLKEVLQKLGTAGVKGAEAGKQLGIAFRKLKEQQNANRT